VNYSVQCKDMLTIATPHSTDQTINYLCMLMFSGSLISSPRSGWKSGKSWETCTVASVRNFTFPCDWTSHPIFCEIFDKNHSWICNCFVRFKGWWCPCWDLIDQLYPFHISLKFDKLFQFCLPTYWDTYIHICSAEFSYPNFPS